ncbi:RNA polymerase sigma factor [Pedobacter deserti]|uniref:RNA polymerase sigma factor n=1 Tax=Pedobacter deserti TaxID=2817382 RepID=UPI002109FFC1|nr:RNA polymerase sigma-70 factor [Pedobacter sp. SYSU D00382]
MKSRGKLSDQALTQLLQRGDYAAFTEIYNRNWEPLLRYISRVTGEDNEGAQDILQEVFISLWNRHSLIVNADIKPWLYGAARRNALFHLRTAKTRHKYITNLAEYLSEVSSPLDEEFDAKELTIIIDQEIDRLPEKMREIFLLSRRQNLSYKEIAEQLNISDKTVKKQISNVLKIFRQRLDRRNAGLIAILALILFKS